MFACGKVRLICVCDYWGLGLFVAGHPPISGGSQIQLRGPWAGREENRHGKGKEQAIRMVCLKTMITYVGGTSKATQTEGFPWQAFCYCLLPTWAAASLQTGITCTPCIALSFLLLSYSLGYSSLPHACGVESWNVMRPQNRETS